MSLMLQSTGWFEFKHHIRCMTEKCSDADVYIFRFFVFSPAFFVTSSHISDLSGPQRLTGSGSKMFLCA